MAKKKRRSGRRKGRRGKHKRVGSSKVPAAVGAGALGTTYEIVMHGDALPYVIKNPNVAGIKAGVVAATAGAKLSSSYIPLAAGLLIHWGKNKPVLKIVGKPLDNLSKKVLHRPL